MVSGRPKDLAFNVVNQISLKTASLTELKRLYTLLKQRTDISKLAPVTHGNAISVYFEDPEGNRIELFVNTDFYCIQPMREPVNLDQPNDQIWAMIEAHARKQKNFRPRSEWLVEMTARMAQGPSPPAAATQAVDTTPVTRIIRFVDAYTGLETYGDPGTADDSYQTAEVLTGDPVADPPVPFARTGRTATVGRLLTPIAPPNILCIGLNYMKHWEEGAKMRGIALPTRPVIFMKTSNTVAAHGGEIWRPNMAGEDDALNPAPDDQSLGNNAGALDYEAELCIVIGKRCRNATKENALSYVLGYCNGNDVSSRHWQRFCNRDNTLVTAPHSLIFQECF